VEAIDKMHKNDIIKYPTRKLICSMMRKDGIKKKSADCMEITGKIFDISASRPYLEKDDIDAVIREKRARLDGLISFCEEKGSCAWLFTIMVGLRVNLT
jgi:hypothetical protein